MSDGVKVFQPKAQPQVVLRQSTKLIMFLLLCAVIAAVAYSIVGIPWAVRRMAAPWSGFGTGPDRLAGTWVGDLATGRFKDGPFATGQPQGPAQPVMINISFQMDTASLTLRGTVTHCGSGETQTKQPFDGPTVHDPQVISLPVHIGKGGTDYEDYDLFFFPGALKVRTEPQRGPALSGTLHKGDAAEFTQLCRAKE